MPTCQRILDIWFWQNILHAHTVISVTPKLFLAAVLSINCDAVWRHGGTYTGVICDLGWPLVNTVLLHWSCQSDSQSVSQFQEKAWREWRHAVRKGAWLNGGKTSIPSSQSQSTETLKWCGISPEAYIVELGERGLNVTLATLKSEPVNYHKWHDDCYWILWDDHITGVNKTSTLRLCGRC